MSRRARYPGEPAPWEFIALIVIVIVIATAFSCL